MPGRIPPFGAWTTKPRFSHVASSIGSLNTTEISGRGVVTTALSGGENDTTVGRMVSSVTLTLTGCDHSPTPFITRAQIVLSPSPPGTVQVNWFSSGAGADQVVPDPTPPVASLHVAGGATMVNSTTVTLLLAGFDDLSGVTQMSLSNDGTIWSAPAPLENQFTWTVPGGDGLKTIWARVMNGVGLWSQPVTVSVTLDTTSPTVASFSPPDKAVVATPRPQISVVFSEPIDDATWESLGLVVQAPNGGILPGTYLYYPATRTGTFTPSADLLPGYVYIAAVGDVRDLAGNKVVVTEPWTLSYVPASSVTASVSPRVSVIGSSVTMSGTASVPAGASLQLDARVRGTADYSPIGTIVPSGGRYSLTLVPPMNTDYRVSYSGSAVASAASADAAAIVRRTVSLPGLSASTRQAARVGRPVTLRAQIAPAGVATVSFRLYRYDASRRHWVYAGSYGRSSQADGTASLTWTPRAVGSFYWRVVVYPTPEYANNISPVYRYTVSR